MGDAGAGGAASFDVEALAPKLADGDGEAERALLTAMSESYAAFDEVVAELVSACPSALELSSVRALHLMGMQAEQLPRRAYVHGLRAWFRADHSRSHEAMDVGDRADAASMCVAAATAELSSMPGANAAVLEAADALTASLLPDLDPLVASRAAWAAGLRRLSGSEEIAALLERTVTGSGGAAWARRQLAARAPLVVLGDEDEAPFVDELCNGLGRGDRSARVFAVRTLTLGIATAPTLVLDLTRALLDDKDPALLTVAAEMSHHLPEPEASQWREEIAAFGDCDHAPLRLLLGRAEGLAAALQQSMHELTTAAHRAPRAAASQAVTTVAHLTSLPSDLAGPARREVEAAASLLLHGASPLRHACQVADALYPDGEAGVRHEAALRASVQRCLRTCRDLSEGEPEPQRRAWWDMARAIDSIAHPSRALAADSIATIASTLGGRRIHNRAAQPGLEKPRAPRAMAIAFARALQLAHEATVIDMDDVLALLLFVPVPSLARRALSLPQLAFARATHEALEHLDRACRQSEGRAEVLHHLREVSASIQFIINDTDKPLWRGTAALVRGALAVVEAQQGSPADRVVMHWSAAAQHFAEASQKLEAKLGLAPFVNHEAVAANEDILLASLRSLARGAGFAGERERGAPDAKTARRRVEASIPLALEGVVAALFDEPLSAAKPSPTSEDDPYPPGRRLGDFEVIRRLGAESAQGYCLLVRRRAQRAHPNAKKWVLKVPRTKDARLQFRDEAKALLELSKEPHPAIVGFRGFLDMGVRVPYLLMEFVEGTTLEDRLESGPPLADDDVWAMAKQLVSALAFSHQQKVAHHDIKPANIMLRGGDPRDPVLVDWGLAGASNAHAGGTPLYLAPEQWSIRQRTDFGGPSDIFALGCVLYEAHTDMVLLDGPLEKGEVADDDLLRDANPYNGWPAAQFYFSTVSGRHDILRARIDEHVTDPDLASFLIGLVQANPGDRTPVEAAQRVVDARG